jgi:hypothetical protein
MQVPYNNHSLHRYSFSEHSYTFFLPAHHRRTNYNPTRISTANRISSDFHQIKSKQYDKIDKNEPEVDWRRRIEDVEVRQIEAIYYR